MAIFNPFKSRSRSKSGHLQFLAAGEIDFTYQPENNVERWHAHRLDEYEPDLAQFDFKVDEPVAYDRNLAERLIRYYRHLEGEMIAREITLGADMWATITKGHASLGQALDDGNVELVSAVLHEVATGTLVSGFMNVQPYQSLRARFEARRIEAKWFADKLLSLGEAFGCSPVQGVEQGPYGFKDIDLSLRLRAVQNKLPFKLTPPSAGGGCFGYKFGEEIFNVKDIYAIYTAEQVRRFVAKETTPHVAEIGGGTGTLAYYLSAAGINKVSVFDLPTVSIIQAYYLIRSKGTEAVWLYGEQENNAPTRVLPFWALNHEPDQSIALFVNQDSLPEMERKIALNYMELFKRKGSALFSINQEGQAKYQLESQSLVYELTDTAGGFTRLHRHLHWMRVGYVEELYQVLS